MHKIVYAELNSVNVQRIFEIDFIYIFIVDAINIECLQMYFVYYKREQATTT
jgi:hypothetical protein